MSHNYTQTTFDQACTAFGNHFESGFGLQQVFAHLEIDPSRVHYMGRYDGEYEIGGLVLRGLKGQSGRSNGDIELEIARCLRTGITWEMIDGLEDRLAEFSTYEGPNGLGTIIGPSTLALFAEDIFKTWDKAHNALFSEYKRTGAAFLNSNNRLQFVAAQR